MNKMKMWLALIVLLVMAGFIFTSCAVPTDTAGKVITPQPFENSIVLVEHLYGGVVSSYTVDYLEDKDRNVGCYVYDGNESGSIFCFKLGE